MNLIELIQSNNSNMENVPLLSNYDKKGVDESIKTSGVRIKKIASIALITLVATFSAIAAATTIAAFVTAFTVTSIVPTIILSSVALTSAVALMALGLLKAWEKVTPHLPEFLRKQANNIQSLVCALLSSAALGAIWLVDYTKFNVKPKDVDISQPLIIGVHGFMGSGNNWVYHFKRLKEVGYKNFATINLGSIFKPIDDGQDHTDTYVNKLRKLVLEYKNNVQLPEGKPLEIQFVCHSMGGLVARQYNQRFSEIDGVKIKDIITLGTPLNGTPAASLASGISPSAKQMKKECEFIKKQQEKASLDDKTHHYNIASKCDFIVGCQSAKSGKAKLEKIDELDGTGHVSFLFSDKAADLIIDHLNASNQLTA